MRAIIDLHAAPGAQTPYQSFTGRRSPEAGFFKDLRNFERGKRVMRLLAELILYYEAQPETAGVVLGLELLNEPDWSYWETTPGIKGLYEEMVPQIRSLLPARRYAILLNFMDSPRVEGARWLAMMRVRDRDSFENVVYDAHIYHSYGDDNKMGADEWHGDMDSCKTCCRDPLTLAELVEAKLPIVVGEYSLNTGFAGSPDFYLQFMQQQLSAWANIPGMIGSFFWNFLVLRQPGSWYKEMSLLQLFAPQGPLPPVSQMNLSSLCPGMDLTRCPQYDPEAVTGKDDCVWQTKTTTLPPLQQPWQAGGWDPSWPGPPARLQPPERPPDHAYPTLWSPATSPAALP
eukprot:CAMPEP_0177263812 /NCGR_PEP_ID=MMETSP0367-20130122/61198_1 /TAXON_ID=447022 ORGANISM="Scrippsiella hangoei-like, Strain SHHI-4" /NCGR_SAMPLE_ID=MMETSP0367 /ASSEMBLY_ACC=CAM_ASM_000362 /LENGTH=343 /DNA_ID=CAMNT_0018718835 /DNA_START=12 /DNA_END=1039 /DNA_ORIENTATION=+